MPACHMGAVGGGVGRGGEIAKTDK
jgi:hypothetical protein